MARAVPLMRSQLVGPVLAYARAAGVDPAAILAELGLPRTAEADVEVIVPLPDLRALFAWLEDVTGDPLVGVHMAAKVGRGTYGLIEYICRASSTLEDALRAIARYAPLLDEIAVVHVERRDGLLYYTHSIPGEAECLGRQGNELYVAVIAGLGRELAGRPTPIERAWLAHPAPPRPLPLGALIGAASVDYGAGSNGFAVRFDVAEQAVRTADPVLRTLLVAQADELASLRRAQTRFVGQVRQTIKDQLERQLPTVESTARALRLSPRALQRKLASERSTFQDLVESVREDVARHLLRDGDMPVNEVSAALKYADPSAFVRAFKRWTGATPGEFRQG